MASILRIENSKKVSGRQAEKLVEKTQKQTMKRVTANGPIGFSKKPSKSLGKKLAEKLRMEKSIAEPVEELPVIPRTFEPSLPPIRDSEAELYFANSAKALAIDVLSQPITPDKRPILRHNIQTNGFMNSYIQQRTSGLAGTILGISDNMKFGAHYLLEWTNSYRGISRMTGEMEELKAMAQTATRRSSARGLGPLGGACADVAKNNRLKDGTNTQNSTEISGPAPVHDNLSASSEPVLDAGAKREDEPERREPDTDNVVSACAVAVPGEQAGLSGDDSDGSGREN